MNAKRSLLLRDLHPRISLWLNLLLLTASGLFIVGVFAPMITTKKLLIFSHRVSLAEALYQLLAGDEYILFVVIFVFSILFPIVKLVLLYRVWNGAVQDHGGRARYLELLAKYGKWSMLDVFVVAVFLVALKLGPLAQVEIHSAVYAFAASVVGTMYATARISKYAEAAPAPPSTLPEDSARGGGEKTAEPAAAETAVAGKPTEAEVERPPEFDS